MKKHEYVLAYMEVWSASVGTIGLTMHMLNIYEENIDVYIYIYLHI